MLLIGLWATYHDSKGADISFIEYTVSKLAIEGSKFEQFSRNRMKFNPSMGRLVALIEFSTISLSGFFAQSLPAASSDHCILMAGKPLAVRIQ